MPLPTNIDTSYPDDGGDASVKLHQQHHDTVHTLHNLLEGIGASPGGELGGTWVSPTVDATHSGSTHAAVQAAAEATAATALSTHVTNAHNGLLLIRTSSSSSITLALSDLEYTIVCTNNGAVALHVPQNATVDWPQGFWTTILAASASTVITIVEDGSTSFSHQTAMATRVQGSMATLINLDGANDWIATGDLE